MDVVFTFIIPIIGFILAVVGAWDKLVFGFKYFSKKRTERQLKKLKFDLDILNKYNEQQNILIAYLFKQTFLLIIIVLFASLIPVLPEANLDDKIAKYGMSAVLSWFAGFFAGRGIRVTNFVVNYEKNKSKIEDKISKIEVSV